MKIKICGLHPARDVQLCIDLKVDFLGFVFYEKSPRHLNLKERERRRNRQQIGGAEHLYSNLFLKAAYLRQTSPGVFAFGF